MWDMWKALEQKRQSYGPQEKCSWPSVWEWNTRVPVKRCYSWTPWNRGGKSFAWWTADSLKRTKCCCPFLGELFKESLWVQYRNNWFGCDSCCLQRLLWECPLRQLSLDQCRILRCQCLKNLDTSLQWSSSILLELFQIYFIWKS